MPSHEPGPAPFRVALTACLVLATGPTGCQRDSSPHPAGILPGKVETNPVTVENPDASAFEGRWEGTVGGQRMRAEPERVRMEPLGEMGLFSFGIGCRVPYTLDDRGPFQGTPRTCVLALEASGAQEYALMFAEPPDATLTLTKGGIEIELRGVEDDTGEPVQLRFTGSRTK